MPPRRQQPTRQAQASAHSPDVEVIAKRTRRHLDELERSNYAEPSGSSLGMEDEDEDEGGGKGTKGRARQTISDKRVASIPGAKKKKSTMNVRSAVLYRKNLATLIDQSGISNLPPHIPTYLTAAALTPKDSPRVLCSVCGYRGRYKCMKCALPYCDLKCQAVHDQTRCERRVI